MAKGDGQTLEKLYIELGLDLSKLQADILAADRTVTENLGRLNREKNIIKLRMEADISGLDRVKDATQILEIREKALNQQLTLTTDRMKILEAAYKQIAANSNSTAMAVNKAEQAFLKEKIAVGQLQQQLKELASQKPPPVSTNNLLSGYQNIKGNVAGKLNELTTAFSQLSGATASADSALTSTLGLIGSVPTTTGKAIASLLSLPIVFKGIENSLVDLIKASASAGDSVYVMSRGFQMSIADTSKFTAMCKTAGVEVNDLATVIKTVQRQIVRTGDDSKAAQWLKRYGESAFDANGHLKNLNDMALALSRGLKKAQAEGNGMTFILGAMGKAAGAVSADVITALEDLEGNYELSAKLVKNGLANPALAHDVQGQLNAMNLQASFMKATFESALLPVANEIIPRMTERMGKFTTLIKDNKDVILDLGRDVAEVWGSIEKMVDKVNDGLSFLAKLRRDNTVVRDLSTEDLVKKYKDDSAIKHADDLLKAEIANGDYSAEDMAKLSARSELYNKELQRAQEEMKNLWQARREDFAKQYKPILEKYKDDKDIKTMTDLLSKLTDEEKKLIQNDPSEFFGSLQEKVGALNLELQKLRETSEAVNNEVKNFKSIAADLSPIGQERQALEQNDEVLETLRKARQYRENAQAIIDKMGMSDYQQKKYDLQRWLQGQLPREEEQSNEKYLAVMEEYKARSLQIEQERADKLAEIRESINAADKTALQQRIDSIEKEKAAWIQAGMEESEAVELAQKKITRAYEEAAQKAQEHWRNVADIEYSMTHTAFEKELRDIELWKDAQREKADTAEEISGIIAEAAAKEADAFEREVDRIKGKVQSLEDKIFEQEHSRYENDLRKLAQERYRLYQEGIHSPAMIERYYQNELSKLKTQAAQGGDYTKSPTNDGKQRGGNGIVVIGGDQIIDDGLIRGRQEEIGLLVDENKIRAQVLANMSESERQLLAAQQSLRNFADTQKFLPPAEKPTTGYQLIEGDKVIEMPEVSTAYLQEFNSALQQTTAGIEQFTPQTQEISAEPLQEFNAALERISSEMERLNPFEPIANAGNFLAERLNQAAQDLPTEYFRNLADGAKSVSTMQLSLTDSTMKLIDAQEKLRKALTDLPSDKTQMATNLPTDGFRQLSTQDFLNQRDLLNRRTRELERLPASQPQSKGLNLGFDMDTAGTVLGLGALIAGIGGAPITAPIAAGITALSALGGLAKGTYDNTTENANTFESIDLTQLSMPLSSLDANVQTILQEIQTPQETALSFETIVMPLNAISNTIENILLALSNRNPQPINISPNMNIDLGGAYVFDESLKKSLVDDITNKIVTAITSTVQQATNQFGNYSYGA